MKKRLFSILLAVAMVITMLPAPIFADTIVTTWTGLAAAISSAPTNGTQTNIYIEANFDASSEILIPNGANIAIESNGGPYTIKRGSAFVNHFFKVQGGGKLALKNAALDGNGSNVTAASPVVYVSGTGEFTMDGAAIRNVKGNVGSGQPAGVFVQANGIMTMKNSSVIENVVNFTANGAFYVAGTLNMEDSSVVNCTGTMTGGVGVYLGTFNMSGSSTITGNKGDFGGVLLSSNAIFNLSGTPNIGGNIKTNGTTPCNVFFGTTTSIMNITGALSNTTPIGVTSYIAATVGNPINITGANNQNWRSYFVSDNPSYNIRNSGSGNAQILQLAVEPSILTWSDLKAAVAAAPVNGTETVLEVRANLNADSEINIPNGADIVIQSSPDGPYTITRDTAYTTAFFGSTDGGKLNLKNITLDGNTDQVTSTYPIVSILDGEFTMDTGAIIQNIKGDVDGSSVGVYIEAGSTMNMKAGAEIRNAENIASNSYGALVVSGTFNMEGGSISGCKADNGAGIAIVSGSAQMSGGSVSSNISNRGGVLILGGSLSLSGAPDISGNKKADNTTDCNVLFISGSSITVGAGGLTNTTPIGVTSFNAPSAGSPVNITAASDQDWSGYFTSDKANYAIQNSGSGNSQAVQLAVSSTINVGDSSGSNLPTGVGYAGNLFTIGTGANNSTINVMGTTNINTIVVANGVTGLTMILKNVSITSPIGGSSPIDLKGNASVAIQLADGTTNTLDATSANQKAGLCVPNGTVVAIGGTGRLDVVGGNEAAGIGGGQNSAGGTITINGGTINAVSTYAGAGIGGGNNGDGGNITINGGNVTSTSNLCEGAGIGGGYGGAGGAIHINGGVVIAKGDNFGSGIGGGASNGGAVITITGNPIIMAASRGNGKMAVNAANGSSGNVMNTKLNSAISTSATTYLKCNGNILPLPANYQSFAFYTPTASEVKAYSDPGCNTLLGSVVTNPAGTANIPVVDLSTSPTGITQVILYKTVITVNKDGAVWTDTPPAMKLSESSTSLSEELSGSLSNGVYTFTGLDPAKSYYVWDTTNHQYTGKSVASVNANVAVDYYTVTLSSTAGITSTSGSGTYLGGSDVPISAVVGGGYNWSKWVLNSNGNLVSTTNAYTITGIAAAQSYKAVAAVNNTPNISTASLPNGTVGMAYSQALAATFVGPPPAWSISAGNLPAGLTLNTGTGAISGTPTMAGTSTFTVQATNMNGSGTKTYTVVIAPAPATYTLNILAGNGGTVSSAGGTYGAGTSVSITATSNSHYSFSGWTSSNGGSFTNASSANTTFTMPANNTTVTASFSYNGGGGGSRDEDPAPASTKPAAPPVHVPIIVDNNEYYIGSVAIDNNTATITVDQSEFDKQLTNAKHSVVVPVASDANTVVAQLVVKNVQDMNDKGVPLMVQTGNVSYNIPASSIDTKSILSALDAADPSLAPVNITIKTNMEQSAQTLVNAAVLSEGSKVIVPPVQFEVTAAYKDKTYHVECFDRFVSRSVEITPEQAQQITTAIVVNSDGTTRHVPTFVYQKEGKWYAQINSLTNSTYVLIFNQMRFTDTAGKWYQGAAEEMGSRKVINGIGSNCFAGDKDITRAEFAAMIVRALGLPASGIAEFTDVPSTAWYSGAVATAAQYGIVSGIGNNKFAPEAKITREEAMQMVYNASRLTPYEAVAGADNTKNFIDYGTQSPWAAYAVDFNINNEFIQGSNGQVHPKSNITRAETVTVILRLLQKSGLVDMRIKL